MSDLFLVKFGESNKTSGHINSKLRVPMQDPDSQAWQSYLMSLDLWFLTSETETSIIATP